MADTSDVTRGSLSSDQVAEYRDALTRHYGEPVRPVGEYCNAFREWANALRDCVEREGDVDRNYFAGLAPMLGQLELAISKSAMLSRLIYGGEKARARMCPVHKGHWSGLAIFRDQPECGCELTGWLPNDLP